MQQHSSGKVPVDDFASGGSFFQQLNQNQTSEMIGIFFVNGIFEGDLADGRYKLSHRSVDPVTATVCFHVDYPFTQKTLLIVARFATRLTCDILEPFLDLLPVDHVPLMGNVFGSLVVVLEIIRVPQASIPIIGAGRYHIRPRMICTASHIATRAIGRVQSRLVASITSSPA